MSAALEAAAELVRKTLPPTPQLEWPLLSQRCGTRVVVKHENHQPTGAFKLRGGLVYNARSAAMTRQHHDSNALCLGAGEFPADELVKWVRLWLSTPFDGGRHQRRVGKFEALEKK